MKNNYLLLFGLMLCSAIGFTQQDRVMLCETFTSSTCPPCNPGNVTLQGVLDDPINDGNHCNLKYQMSWPGAGDPYYTDEGQSRRSYYGVSSVPQTHLDGGTGFNPAGSSPMSQAKVDAATAVPVLCDINATYQIDEPGQTVDIQIEIIAHEDIPGGTVLHVAIHEFLTANNIKTNGETSFEHVMKKMVPGAGGTIIPSTTDAGDTVYYDFSYEFQGSYDLPPDAGSPTDHSSEHSVEEFSDLGVIVWVQRITSKEVFQAANAVLGSEVVGVDENASSIVTAKIYPNPATFNAAIAFHTVDNENVDITIVDAMGKVVYNETITDVEVGRVVHDVNTSEFETGMYFVNISSVHGNITKKLQIR